MIIDDNSDYSYVKLNKSLKLTNCFIIQSEFPQRGELLAYYYFHKYRLFDKAVIIHDSVFIQQPINFDTVEDVKFIWHFHHDWSDANFEVPLIENLKTKFNVLTAYEEKDKWFGSFGVQSVITLEFLEKLVEKYDIFNLLNCVNNRNQRMACERIFGLLCCLQKPELVDDPSIFGTIHSYMAWGYTYNKYISEKPQSQPIIKVWSSR